MRNLIAMLAFVLILSSCGGSGPKKDLSKVNVGMSESEITKVVGEPSQKVEIMTGTMFWKYGENSMIIVENGKVKEVVPDIKESEAKIKKEINNLDDKNLK